MPHIQQLSSHVADLIAAGEVVERPASVVKELVEYAIDAGASAIVVEIQRGGMGLIRVTDNGCGIAPEELPTAFLRHATSKLRTAEDLAKIGTLGFRGEALAAISAVSRVDVLTRRPEDAVGAAIHGEGGHMEPVREEGAPEGTTIRVSDLFYNTPARLKFMKKDSAETAAVAGLMQHLALSHPDVSFKFIKDGQESLHTPGDGKLESAVYAALGREFAKTLVPVQGRGGGFYNGRCSGGFRPLFPVRLGVHGLKKVLPGILGLSDRRGSRLRHSPTASIQRVHDRVEHSIKYVMLLGKFHLGLGGMDVHVHRRHRQQHLQHTAGEPALEKLIPVAFL